MLQLFMCLIMVTLAQPFIKGYLKMTVMYIDEACDSAFFNIEDRPVEDYTDILEGIAVKYFNSYPDQEFMSYCVVNFETKKSCIYEFHRTVTYSVTIY